VGPVVSSDLSVIDRLLCDVAVVALPLIHLEPLNSSDEAEKVARDPTYNPQFRYAMPDPELLTPHLAKMERIDLPEAGVGLFFRQARDYLCARLRMRLHLGETEHWQEQVYSPAPQRVHSLAQRILNNPRPSPRRTLDRPFQAEDLARVLKARLKQYRLEDWHVAVHSNISATNTDSANRLVNIRADLTYSMEEMKRLAVHEVDTHVLRAANGYCQPYHIFAVGAVPSYLMTEEGLAVVNEERMGYIDAARNRTFAGRVLAAARATTGPFSEVYAELRDHGFSHAESFNSAKRVKRGLADTSQPGGYIKDQAYLWGRILIEEYVLGGGDLSRLYIGKIALEHVPISQELGLRPARYIPYPYS
jgi:hypothetical protein